MFFDRTIWLPMARIRFVQRDGSAEWGEVGADVSVMLDVVSNGVGGIEGACGGGYVERSQAALLTPPSGDESELLLRVSAREPTSGLGCQLRVPAGIDEWVVHVMEIQS
jgi:ferredoxin